MLRRWQEAQRAERIFWDSEDSIQQEAAKILERYSIVFSEIKSDDGWKILDVGCGPTFVSRMINGGEKYGIDPLMSHFLEKVQDRAMLTSFHFLTGVAECLPFGNDCFDLVVCRNVLDHVQLPEGVLKEMKRVSKSCAILILGVNVYSEFVFRLRKGVECMGIVGLKEKFHPHFFTEETLMKLCSKYFSIVEKKVVFSDEARWIKIKCKIPDIQGRRIGTMFFTSSWILPLFYSLAFTFFWNIIRLLNQMKAHYFLNESVIIAHPR